MDATLGELADCIRREIEVARGERAEISFSFVFPDFNGNYRRKEVGTVVKGVRN